MDSELSRAINMKLAVPFFMVANMESSLDFYIRGLGFTLTNKWEPRGTIEWCWLQLDGVSFMLQEYRVKPALLNRGEGISICIMCADALSIYEAITGRGLSPSEPFVGNGLWVVPVKDPDGYHLYFESPTDVPEETMYSQWKNKSGASNLRGK